MPRQMHFIGYMLTGPTWHNNGAWRHYESDAVNANDPARYERLAQILEEGKFDGLFFVDALTAMIISVDRLPRTSSAAVRCIYLSRCSF